MECIDPAWADVLSGGFFGKRQFVALNPPVECRHSEPHEVLEAYRLEDVLRASRSWGPEVAYLYSPSPGTIAPIMSVPDGEVMIYNIDKCRPEPSPYPLPEPTWVLHEGDGFDYWLPHRHQSIPLIAFY